MKEFGQITLIVLCFVLLAFIIALTGFWIHASSLKGKCERDNNVYECEIQYTPKELEDAI